MKAFSKSIVSFESASQDTWRKLKIENIRKNLSSASQPSQRRQATVCRKLSRSVFNLILKSKTHRQNNSNWDDCYRMISYHAASAVAGHFPKCWHSAIHPRPTNCPLLAHQPINRRPSRSPDTAQHPAMLPRHATERDNRHRRPLRQGSKPYPPQTRPTRMRACRK